MDDVVNWISVLPDGLSKYTVRMCMHACAARSHGGLQAVFADNHINGRMLLNLTSQVLKDELQIGSFGHRQALLDCIKNIQRATVGKAAVALPLPLLLRLDFDCVWE